MGVLLNIFVPGLGHLCLGRPYSGLFIFLGVLIGYSTLFVPGFLLHVWCLWHVHHLDRQALIADMVRAQQEFIGMSRPTKEQRQRERSPFEQRRMR